ncbi:unnamed protein product [Candidula unifasciata]|uniref:Uncharacterized protein n=1 Tax=Candidula unifasciata TaxID=100452 RepID=A0A8S3YYV8_9EUPU|nr:unnamed protein product [Candidula unifasciata]
MGSVNSDSVINISRVGDEHSLHSEDLPGYNLEAYTVVLSTAAHVLSTLFGGSSNIAVIVAITTRRNINKYSYALVLTLFLACCSLNFIWSPLEVADLIMFHFSHRHPFNSYVPIKTYFYLFLILLISFIILLMSIEAIFKIKHCFGKILKKIWPLASTVTALFCSGLLAVIFFVKCINTEHIFRWTYTVIDNGARSTILAFTALAFCTVCVALFIILAFIIKESVYFESGRPHFRQKKIKLDIPEFLISQSNACADNDGGFEHSQSGTPSPTTPKLLSVINPETGGEDLSPIPDLPGPMAKPTGNRLGINMAQVLGRRRHTICQISDSTSAAAVSPDPASRAKQYNYVRKFSVDISALQAQLQNPKICKDAPFQSDIDISKRPASEKPEIPKPLLPQKPLTGSFNEKIEAFTEKVKQDKVESPAGTNNQPPPVIMVSNDDAPVSTMDTEQDNNQNETDVSHETFQEQIKTNPNSENKNHKPNSLIFTKSTEEEDHMSPTLESATSDHSNADSDFRKMARLTLLLSLTFILHMLPVLAMEVLKATLSLDAFINISTCTIAVSSVQTIVYPHLIICCDDVVHRAIHKVKKRTQIACCCRSDLDAHSQVDDSSSVSQV